MTTNDTSHRQVTLTCTGQVLVPFKAQPRYANFRGIDEATTPEPRTVTIKRGDGGPLELEVVGAGNPGVQWELREIKAGEHYELLVGLSPPIKAGKLRSWLKIRTGIEESPETTIPVYADIPAGWDESPS